MDAKQIRQAAFLQSQVACSLIEMEAMKAANQARRNVGYSDAYGEDAFLSLIAKYGIGSNDAITTLNA